VHNCCLYRQVEVLETFPPQPQMPTIMNDVQFAPDDTGAGTSTPPSRTGTQTPPTGHDTNPALRTRKTEGFAVEAMNTDPGTGRPVPAGLSAPTAVAGGPVLNAVVLTVTFSAAVAPGPTAAVSPAGNTAASSAIVNPGHTTAVGPLPKKIVRPVVSRVSAVDLLPTVPPHTGTQEVSGRGQGPGCHTVLDEEMEFPDLATAPPGYFLGLLARSPSEHANSKTQLPSFEGLPRGESVEGDVEHSECVMPVYRRLDIPAQTERPDVPVSERTPRAGNTATPAPKAHTQRWCRAGKGGRFGSNEERKRYYFEKSVEVRRIEVVQWRV